MIHLKQTIENIIYGYDSSEFLPVFYDGELANRKQFVAYKAHRAVVRASDAFDRLQNLK